MEKISRNIFLKQCANIGVISALTPYSVSLIGRDNGPKNADKGIDKNIMSALVEANDRQVELILNGSDSGRRQWGRRLGYDFSMLSASYCYPDSKFYEDPAIVPQLEKTAEALLSSQNPDGTVDAGNLGSPPDTGFIIEILATGAAVLIQNKSKVLEKAKADIKRFIVNAGEALTTGGVHTPNHRFVVCSALAGINKIYPDPKYVERINDWLGEGVFNDNDGHFPERSRNYSDVEDHSLITIGRLLDRPELFEPVRKNLDMTYYYMNPEGDLVTNDSRRQDQYSTKPMVAFYLHYRYMAIRDQNGYYAAITKLIESFDNFKENILEYALFKFLEEPLLQKELPDLNPLDTNFEKLFNTSHLLRIRRGDTAMTLFGGVDLPLIIASGRSCSPNFFGYVKGAAELKYMRMASSFFSTGYFYSDGLVKEGDTYILHRKLEVPYYQPLPEDKRKENGDYRLSESIDHRFWNKMDFENRPVSNVKVLESKVKLKENNGEAELAFEVSGEDNVMVTVELCFKEGGEVSGVTESGNNDDNFFLESGTGKYQMGNDTIIFGPGLAEHRYVNRLEGERYSTHRGSLRTPGIHVYLTGITPFVHTLKFS